MTRKFLQGLGLETEVIDKIVQIHGEGIEREKGVAESLRGDITKLEGNLKTARADLAKAKQPLEGAIDWEKKYNDEVVAHTTTKEGLERSLSDEKTAHKTTQDAIAAERDAATVDGLVAELLKAGHKDGEKAVKMSAAVIPKALKMYDRSIVERDKEGNIKNADKVFEFFKGEWGDFFGEVTVEGVSVGKSDGSGAGAKSYTHDQIAKMTPEEINKNWDSVKSTLESKK